MNAGDDKVLHARVRARRVVWIHHFGAGPRRELGVGRALLQGQ
jgi:hypothetical protein